MELYEPAHVAHVALSERVIAALRRAVILGELPDGLHLEEPTLAAKFGVSRLPIREALGKLAHEGFVRIEPRRGAFVVGVTEADVDDLYEFRLLLETHAIRRAAARIDAAGLARLESLIDQMRLALRSGRLDLIAQPDLAFHEAIIDAGGNRRLLAAWEQIVGLIGTILGITDTTYRNMPDAVESHQAIHDALAAGDAAAAERLLREHLANGARVARLAMRTARAERESGAEQVAP